MSTIDIKIVAAACGLIGSVILVVGNKLTQKALSLVARVHEKNLEQETSASPVQVRFLGATKHLKRAEAISGKLRVLGIVLVVLAAALTIYAIHMERSAPKIAEPDSPANGSQPLQSETSRASSGAGSRR